MAETITNAQYQFTSKQTLAWRYLKDNVTTELIFGGGAGGGKTELGCVFVITMLENYPGCRGMIGRKELKALKETTLMTFWDMCKKWGLKEGVDYRYNEQAGMIRWWNGSELLLKDLAHQPSDPEYEFLGSLEITFAFIDEVGQITFKCWETVNTRIRYKLDEFGLIPRLLGTCNPSKKWLYPEFYLPNKEGRLEEHRKFVQALVTDNPHAPESYIANLRKIKNKATKERLLNGNWEYDDDPTCLFDYAIIKDLFTNVTITKKKAEKYLSGDVSRKGRDKMPIYYWEGMQIKKRYEVPEDIKKDTKKSAQWIINLGNKLGVRRSNIILDEDGVGGGVVDNVGCIGFMNGGAVIQPAEAKHDENKKLNYGNLKTQCYFLLAEKAEEGKIGIDPDALTTEDRERLTQDLEQVKQKDADKDGKVYVLDKKAIKEAIGRSPDDSDAIMMRMWFIVSKRARPQIY